MSGGVLGATIGGSVTGMLDLSRSLLTLLTFSVYRDIDERVRQDFALT